VALILGTVPPYRGTSFEAYLKAKVEVRKSFFWEDMEKGLTGFYPLSG